MPGPQEIHLEGMVDDYELDVYLPTPALLNHLGMTLAEFQAEVWGASPREGLAETLRGILVYNYHLAVEGGE